MAGESIRYTSAVPVTSGRVYGNIHVGSTNSRKVEGLGVEASLGADSTWELVFELPGTLPGGTPKLRLLALANATSGDAKVNPKWKSVAVEESFDVASGSFNAEGTQTLSWSTGDNDQWKELKVTLDADTLVAGELLQMLLVFETTSWTLAQISTWLPSIIWE